MLLWPVLAAGLATQALAASVNYPFNNQLPPAAIQGQKYQYVLAADTFSTSEPPQYTANLPAWLSFDEKSLALSGTPPSPDFVSFSIIAKDSAGSATMDAKLQVRSSQSVVSANNNALSSSLKAAGSLQGQSGVVFKPGDKISIQFPQDLFSGGADGSFLSCVTAHHSPLPIWLSFDAQSRTLSGTAPAVNSDVAPEEEHSIVVTLVKDGFALAEAPFNLYVGAHQLTTSTTSDSLDVSPDAYFSYSLPTDKMSLDGQKLTVDKISALTLSSGPAWVSADKSNATLNGTPPQSAANSAATASVVLTDLHGNHIAFDLTLHVSNSKQIFKSDLPTLQVTPDTYWEYQLPNSLFESNSVPSDVSADVSELKWLTFHSSNHTLNGHVPKDFTTSASISLSSNGQTAKMKISSTPLSSSLSSSSATTSSSSASSTSSSATTTTSSSFRSSSSSSPSSPLATSPSTTSASAAFSVKPTTTAKSQRITILCAVLIPACGVILIAALVALICCCRRRKPRAKTPPPVSHPMPVDMEKKMENISPSHSLNTERTVVGGFSPTNSSSNNALKASPFLSEPGRHASTANFMKMDASETSSFDFERNSESEPDHVPPLPVKSSNRSPQTAAVPPPTGATRNSWRQQPRPESNNWQDRQSSTSIATMATDELMTLRLVDHETPLPQMQHQQHHPMSATFSDMNPTASRVLSDIGSLPHPDSGIIYPISESPTREDFRISRYSHNNSTTMVAGTSKRDSESYQTAGSGSSDDDEDFDFAGSEPENHIRAYRNSEGDLNLSEPDLQNPRYAFSNYDTSTIHSVAGPSRHGAMESAKLVKFTKEHSLSRVAGESSPASAAEFHTTND